MAVTFPLDFIAFSLIEIFLQNFLTGVIIYRIYSDYWLAVSEKSRLYYGKD